MARVSPQLICFSYHKSGTSLLLHVMTKVGARLGLRLANHFGLVQHLAPEPDIVLLPHSVLRCRLDRPYRAIRMIRDPRDVWVSGYLYHLRSIEEWCINTDLDLTPPILWPQVDHSVAHWSDDWKRHYLGRLNGRSYQANLLGRSREAGLDFELAGYTGWTLAAMRDWKLNGADALDIRLEDVMADFDGAMLRIFDHFGFTAGQTRSALEEARSEDIRRMDDFTVAERPQIHSRTISKWRGVLSAAQSARFEERYGDVIRALGYETGSAMQRVTQDAGVRLVADGETIRPTSVGTADYSFVVPGGRARVRLESRSGTQCHDRGLSPGEARQLGVRVTEIVIRSPAGEVVMAADDPRLTDGWHQAEHEGTAVWRWTNGSAALPWDGIANPAVVTVACTNLGEYLLPGTGGQDGA
jgi:hypothetical protein